MSTLNPHKLLQQPAGVSIAYRDQLAAAYHEIINNLTEHFNTTSQLLHPVIPIKLTFLSDNGGNLDDTAPKEIQGFLDDSARIVSVLSGIAKPDIIQANTLAQAWVPGGFDFAQTTRYEMTGVGKVTFLNCAPRIDERGAKDNKTNKGEPIYVAILPDGHVISANSRYNFWAFRDMVENGTLEIFEANVQPDGTQFRSRDIFPTHAVVLTNLLTQNMPLWKPQMTIEQRRELLEKIGYVNTQQKLALEDIPVLKQFTIANIDVHGNIKTNTRLSELDEGTLAKLKGGEFKVKIGKEVLPAKFSKGMFERATGEAGISTGSSGQNWQGADHSDGFLEVSIIGEDAAKALKVSPELLRKPIEVIIDTKSQKRHFRNAASNVVAFPATARPALQLQQKTDLLLLQQKPRILKLECLDENDQPQLTVEIGNVVDLEHEKNWLHVGFNGEKIKLNDDAVSWDAFKYLEGIACDSNSQETAWRESLKYLQECNVSAEIQQQLASLLTTAKNTPDNSSTTPKLRLVCFDNKNVPQMTVERGHVVNLEHEKTWITAETDIKHVTIHGEKADATLFQELSAIAFSTTDADEAWEQTENVLFDSDLLDAQHKPLPNIVEIKDKIETPEAPVLEARLA